VAEADEDGSADGVRPAAVPSLPISVRLSKNPISSPTRAAATSNRAATRRFRRCDTPEPGGSP
jgi:hypothetical protein